MTVFPLRSTLLSSLVAVLLAGGGVVGSAIAGQQPNEVLGALRGPGEAPLVAGHRGDRGEAPENTIPAFRAAMAAGVGVLETDVQLTSDGVPVLMHDRTVDRTTDGSGAVADLSLADIEALDAGSWFDPRFAGTRVPTLEEFLALVGQSDSRAFVELKGVWTPDQVAIVAGLVDAADVASRVVLMSFELDSVAAAKQAAPGIPRFILSSRVPDDPVGLVAEYDAAGLATTLHAVEERPDAVTALHAAGARVMLYTLSTDRAWQRALAAGVDGVVTDTPYAYGAWMAEAAPL